MKKYLIVGNGAAGTSAAEEIRKKDATGEITVLSNEDMPFYSRIRLPEFMSKEIPEEALIIKKKKWYEDLNIRLELKTTVVQADADKKVVTSVEGKTFSYDALLIATGSHSFIPPIQGLEKEGVFSVRNVEDVRHILHYAEATKDVVLIGGGLLGLECGNAIRKLGKKVTVVEFFPRLLPRQLDVEGAQRLQVMMEAMGFDFVLGAKTKAITGNGKVSGVLLEGGPEISAQMVLISAGVRPNLEMADFLGLEKDKGIKVDGQMRTSMPDVFAAGDVAEFKGMVYGIWPAATDQGKIAAANMAGDSTVYEGTPMSNKLKVVGIDLASAGNIDTENQMESKILKNGDTYKKIVFSDKVIAGAIMLGDTKNFNKIVKMMADQKDISQIKDGLF
ncbi:MAG: NAD(P)/FAD-dependent oxidoreductase [Desulfobacteraceae bacterium]|nr:NAD(P)/FAD-dependent oxidoreductase [Desulfobacteraceae bacterium]MBU4055760.1 FAD-dependent oxidoreductase [Pseudomonadota bacterium]